MTIAPTTATTPVPVPVHGAVRDLSEDEVVDLCQRETLREALTEAVWLTRGRRLYARTDNGWTVCVDGIEADHYVTRGLGRFATDWWHNALTTRPELLVDYLNTFHDGRDSDQGPFTISEAVRADVQPGTGEWTSLAVAIAVWWDERMTQGVAPEAARMLLELSVASTTLRHLDYRMIVPTPCEVAGGHVTRWGPVLP